MPYFKSCELLKNKTYIAYLNYLIKLIIFVLLFAAIYKQVFLKEEFGEIIDIFQQNLHQKSIGLLVLVFFLMLVNF